MKFYEGGIPTDGSSLFPGFSSEDQMLVQPDCVCTISRPVRAVLGSTDSHGDTGKDLNPPAEGEIRIESRKVVSNQPS